MVHLLPNLPNLPSPLRRAEHGLQSLPEPPPQAHKIALPACQYAAGAPWRNGTPPHIDQSQGALETHPERGYPIPSQPLPGEGVPNSPHPPTRRGGTQSPPPTYPERGYPQQSGNFPAPLPSAPGNAPSPFPSLNPSPPRKKKGKKRKKIKTPAPRRAAIKLPGAEYFPHMRPSPPRPAAARPPGSRWPRGGGGDPIHPAARPRMALPWHETGPWLGPPSHLGNTLTRDAWSVYTARPTRRGASRGRRLPGKEAFPLETRREEGVSTLDQGQPATSMSGRARHTLSYTHRTPFHTLLTCKVSRAGKYFLKKYFRW